MISSLRGTTAHVAVDSVVVDIGGVGFTVAVPAEVARSARVGGEIQLHTVLIVRDDSLSLFGFSTREELTVFGHLLSVSGVGPKSALGVLSALSVGEIAAAVLGDDETPFRRVSGIGPKTAKLIVVQLTGKLTAVEVASPSPSAATPAVAAQVTQALVGLGWPERVAAEAVAGIARDAGADERASVAALLRLTLAVLGPARKETTRG